MSIVGRFRQYCRQIMDISDAPVKIARGIATGISLDFLPIPLISIPVTFIAARLIKGNGLAAALAAALFKWAVPFFYVLNVAVGSLVLRWAHLDRILPAASIAGSAAGGWRDYLALLGYPFLTGAVLNALLVWLLVFFAGHKILLVRQKRKGIV